MIKYVKHKDINKKKWDDCVLNAVNSMVYGMSWYLDIVCPGWDALVSDDYESVMPLPWKKKLGVKYVYQPFFAQQLGVFYGKIADDKIHEFIQAIPFSFLKYETSLNYLNQIKKLSLNVRNNYLLPLDKNYTDLKKAFNENTRRNIKKAEKNNLYFSENVSIDEFITLKRENPVNDFKEPQFQTMENLVSYLVNNNYGALRGVYDDDKHLQAAALFITFKNRVIYLLSASSDVGKENRGMFLVINETIKKHAGLKKILDFEGSMISGVARFFEGFGAHAERYYRIKKSRLPFL